MTTLSAPFSDTAPRRRQVDPDRIRAALVLQRLGWTHQEIARGLCCSLATAYRWLAQADAVREAGPPDDDGR